MKKNILKNKKHNLNYKINRLNNLKNLLKPFETIKKTIIEFLKRDSLKKMNSSLCIRNSKEKI